MYKYLDTVLQAVELSANVSLTSDKFCINAPLFVVIVMESRKAYLPAGIGDLAASLANCTRDVVSMACTLLTVGHAVRYQGAY
jgi:hypothetical protein